MHICSQKNKLYFLYINAHFILFTELHTIRSSQKNTLCPPYHYIRFWQLLLISSPQINTLHSHHRKAHILLSDKHNKSFSVISHWYKQYIIFSDIHNISSFQTYILYPSHTTTHILLSPKLTISTSQINTLYPLQRNAHYILLLYSEI
jgi:hypothetical protein